MDSDVRELQEMREITQMDRGIERYYKEVDAQGAGDVTAGKGMVVVAMDHMIPVITENVRLLESGKTLGSQVPLAYHFMVGLRADAVAYIAARVCVSASHSRSKLTRTAMRIANLISEDYSFEELEQAQPALANAMGRKAKRWSTSGARRRIMRKAVQVAGLSPFGWTEGEKLKLGMKLIDLYVDTTKFAELKLERDGKKTISCS